MPARKKAPAAPVMPAQPRRVTPKITKATRPAKAERIPAAVLQLALDQAIADAGLPPATPEYAFAWERLRRKWRIDRAWPEARIALEIEGGIHMRGRHIRPAGFLSDMEKYNRLALWGWLLIRVTYDMIADGSALALVAEAHAQRRAQSA